MQARILRADGSENIINANALKKGDIVLVRAGELIPNDGEVIDGVASVDESAITGESAPVLKESEETSRPSPAVLPWPATGLKSASPPTPANPSGQDDRPRRRRFPQENT